MCASAVFFEILFQCPCRCQMLSEPVASTPPLPRMRSPRIHPTISRGRPSCPLVQLHPPNHLRGPTKLLPGSIGRLTLFLRSTVLSPLSVNESELVCATPPLRAMRAQGLRALGPLARC